VLTERSGPLNLIHFVARVNAGPKPRVLLSCCATAALFTFTQVSTATDQLQSANDRCRRKSFKKLVASNRDPWLCH
jgi:hypothetical protein